MPGSSLTARPPRGGGRMAPTADPEALAGHLEDAARFPGGHARAIAAPASEAQVAALLRSAAAVLAIGAQSSLTGGATPMGDTLLDTRNLTGIEPIGADRVRVGAGVVLHDLTRWLAAAGRYYPPVPTFPGALVGGTVATNAAGAATFKYGATRDWVEALTVVLASGDVLDVERGATRASGDGLFELRLRGGPVRIPIPGYRTPRLPKISAGYFSAPQMDLIDLFIGSEGTLGIVTAATLRVMPAPPAACTALVPFPSEAAALGFTRALRDAARETWRSCSRRGVDAAAIEFLDARSLEIVRADQADLRNGVRLPPGTAAALVVVLELPAGTGAGEVFDQIGRARDPLRPDTPLLRFCALLDEAGVLDDTAIAAPGESARAAQLAAVREAVPAGVNDRIARARRTADPRIEKMAADVAVPFDRLDALLARVRAEATRHGLDAIVWGHASDGNVHPNIVPGSFAELEAARAAVAAIGRAAIELGGTPMAEHGVGRNPVKQQLLRELYGDAGVESMRAVKRALDPEWKLAPGVLFGRS